MRYLLIVFVVMFSLSCEKERFCQTCTKTWESNFNAVDIVCQGFEADLNEFVVTMTSIGPDCDEFLEKLKNEDGSIDSVLVCDSVWEITRITVFCE